MNQNPVSQRIASFDTIRVVAIIAVVLTHVSAPFILSYPTASNEFIIGNICDSLSHLGVPLFVMLSGALLLKEEKPFPMKKMFKSILNLFLLLYIWSTLYAVSLNIMWPFFHQEAINWKSFGKALIAGYYHQWYLFMMIGLYLITPILKTFVKKDNIQMIKWLLLLLLTFQFLTEFGNTIFYNITGSSNVLKLYISKFRVPMIDEYLAYYLLGWYLTTVKLSKKQRYIIYLLGAIGAITTVLGAQFFTTKENPAYNSFYSSASINMLIYSAAIFIFLLYAKKSNEIGKSRAIFLFSKLSFGIYLIHPLVLFFVLQKVHFESVIATLSVIYILTLLISFAAVWGMSKIPIVKKMVRC